MKHPKRFCVECDREEYLTIRGGKTPMYYCRRCGAQVCRVGDGDADHRQTNIRGGLGPTKLSDESTEGLGLTDLARMNPDVLSDEHTVWPARDRESEVERQAMIATLKIAYEKLTPRQREIAEAVDEHGSQTDAARILGLRKETVSITMKQIKNKLSKYI